jgi:hypothetical protein
MKDRHEISIWWPSVLVTVRGPFTTTEVLKKTLLNNKFDFLGEIQKEFQQ